MTDEGDEEEDIATLDADEDMLLSANASGMSATVAEAAANRERDFFIRKNGEETCSAYHSASILGIAFSDFFICFYKYLSHSACSQYAG